MREGKGMSEVKSGEFLLFIVIIFCIKANISVNSNPPSGQGRTLGGFSMEVHNT